MYFQWFGLVWLILLYLFMQIKFVRIHTIAMEETLGSATTTINSSNIGFQLLKKHGWKEGTGLGISEQGRLEPVETRVKNNKRGLGADIVKKKVVKPDHGDSSKGDNKQVIFFKVCFCSQGLW